MKPLRRLRKFSGAHSERATSIVSSSTSKRARNTYDEPGGASASYIRPEYHHLSPSVASTRSRSVERRNDTARNRRRSRSKSEKRQGGGERWFERLGGSVVVTSRKSKRSKSHDETRIGGSTRSYVNYRERSRSRGERQNRSRERSSSRTRRSPKSVLLPNHEISRGRSVQSINSGKELAGSSVGSKARSRSIGPISKSSNSTPSPLKKSNGKRNSPSSKDTIALGIPAALEKRSQQQPQVSMNSNNNATTPWKRSHTNAPTLQTKNPPHCRTETPPRLPSKASGTAASALLPAQKLAQSDTMNTARWPRLSFRRKKIEEAATEFQLDPEQRQRLLTMILGNNGSMFEERSIFDAPNGHAMRDSQRISAKDEGPPKSCGERVVDAALLFEAVSASPFICIQTICCVNEDYLEEERAKLKSRAKVETKLQPPKPPMTDQPKSYLDGPPEVIQVVPTKTPRNIPTKQDAPSVSVFTTGTHGSNAGFWLPFGLGHCADSVADEREYTRPTKEREIQTAKSESPITAAIETPTAELGDIFPLGNLLQGPKGRLNYQIASIPDRDAAPESDDARNDDSGSDETPITKNSSIDESVDKQLFSAGTTVKDPLSSLADDSENGDAKHLKTSQKSRKKGLDEWEAMEARLKAILSKQAMDGDSYSINSF